LHPSLALPCLHTSLQNTFTFTALPLTARFHLAGVQAMDYEAGGSAAEYVAQQIPKVSRLELIVSEDMARLMFRQLIAGLEHLHDNHVAHRWVGRSGAGRARGNTHAVTAGPTCVCLAGG